jgi:hypothetical protein
VNGAARNINAKNPQYGNISGLGRAALFKMRIFAAPVQRATCENRRFERPPF